MCGGSVDDGADRFGEILLSSAKDILEQREAVEVQAFVEQQGVVQFRSAEGGVAFGLKFQRAEALLGAGEEVGALVEGHASGVRLLQLVEKGGEKLREQERILPASDGVLACRRVVVRFEEKDGAAVPDEVREGFVEVRVPADVAGGVEQLVKDGLDQADAVLPQRGRQQRVVEPAERAEGRGGAHVGVEAPRLQRRRLGVCLCGAEEALVGYATDDREPPGMGPQAQALGGGEHVDHLLSFDVGIGGKGSVHLQS